MKILIHGSTGRMGKILCDLLTSGYNGLELAAKVSPEETSDPAKCVYTSLEEVSCDVDGVIDFSHHTAVGSLMDFCICKNLPVVVATTGHTPEEKAAISAAAEKIPVFFSANMSIGVALLAELAKKAASVFPEANIEIVEKHHNQKLDVPSGTALLLAHRIQDLIEKTKEVVKEHAMSIVEFCKTNEIDLIGVFENFYRKQFKEFKKYYEEKQEKYLDDVKVNISVKVSSSY